MFSWHNTEAVRGIAFKCGYCSHTVGPNSGYRTTDRSEQKGNIRICPNCGRPSFFHGTEQYPGPSFGGAVAGISDKEVAAVYEEARRCTAASAFTAAVLLCRKLLMNLASRHGAEPDLTFKEYVDYLDSHGHIPPQGKEWVDQIRSKGNDATHELPAMSREDAEQIVRFAEMLLRFNYEMPSILKGGADD